MKLRGRALAILTGGTVISIALLGGAVALASSGAAPAAETLVSQGKPATASSSGGCCAAKNVNDGSTSTRWASAANIDPSWIYIDLGSTFSITHVKLTWDKSCAVNYEVQTSPDHNTWTDIFKTTTGNGGVDDLTGLKGSGRYVRVLGTKRCRADASHGYSLDEFQVYSGTSGGTVPQPPGAPQQISITPTSVSVSWAASSDAADVATYQIFKDGQLCSTVNAPTLQGTCSGLSPNVDYGIYINATNAAGDESQPSPTTEVHTPKIENNPPTVPTNVKVGTVTATSAALAWTASTDDTAVASYNVYRDSVDPANKLGSSTGNAASADLQGLTASTTYTVVVTAVDASKNESGPSTSVTFTTPAQGQTCTDNFCGTKQIATDDDVVWGLVTSAGRYDPVQRAGRARHRAPQPDHRGEEDRSARYRTCRAPTVRAA